MEPVSAHVQCEGDSIRVASQQLVLEVMDAVEITQSAHQTISGGRCCQQLKDRLFAFSLSLTMLSLAFGLTILLHLIIIITREGFINTVVTHGLYLYTVIVDAMPLNKQCENLLSLAALYIT